MRLYDVVKVFDLCDAPLDLRDADDVALLRRADRDGSTALPLRVGHYDATSNSQMNGASAREITYAEFQLHRWLVEQGAKEGEDVFLRWTQSGAASSAATRPASVTVLRKLHLCRE